MSSILSPDIPQPPVVRPEREDPRDEAMREAERRSRIQDSRRGIESLTIQPGLRPVDGGLRI